MTHSFDTNSYFLGTEKLYAVNQSILCKNIAKIVEFSVIMKILSVICDIII